MNAAPANLQSRPHLMAAFGRPYAIIGNTYPIRDILVSRFRGRSDVPLYSPITGAWHLHARSPETLVDFCRDAIIRELSRNHLAAVRMDFDPDQVISRFLFRGPEPGTERECCEATRAILSSFGYSPCPVVGYTILSHELSAPDGAEFLSDIA